jgi:hypothetical protein
MDRAYFLSHDDTVFVVAPWSPCEASLGDLVHGFPHTKAQRHEGRQDPNFKLHVAAVARKNREKSFALSTRRGDTFAKKIL